MMSRLDLNCYGLGPVSSSTNSSLNGSSFVDDDDWQFCEEGYSLSGKEKTSTTFASILLKKLDLHLDKKASQLKHNPPVGGSLNLGVSTISSMWLGQSEEIKDVFVESDVQN